MIDQDEVLVLLKAISEVHGLDDVVFALVERLKEHETPEGRALIAAFSVRLDFEGPEGRSANGKWTNQFDGSMLDREQLDSDVLTYAAENAGTNRIVISHLGQLIWEIRPGKRSLAIADEAIESSIDLSNESAVDRLERIQYAAEAASLAKRRKLQESLVRARASLLVIADEAVAAGSAGAPEPGVLIRAVELFDAFGGARPEACARLEAGIGVYNHGHIRTDLAEVLISMSPVQSRPALAEAEVDRMLQDAAVAETHMKEHTARAALRLSRQFGLKDAQGRAAAVLASIKPEDYNFKSRKFSIPVPSEDASKFEAIRRKLAEEPPSSAWLRWSVLFPKLDPIEDRDAPPMGALMSLVTQTTIAAEGHVTHEATTDEERARNRHFELDRWHLEYLYQFVIAPGFFILLQRDDAQTALNELIDESMLFTEKGKDRIRRAVAAYKDSDWDIVADSLPTIESGVRYLARESGISTYSPAGAANQFKTLGGLISDLTPFLPEGREGRFWAFVLTEDLGYNIRNLYLHGILENPNQFHATLIIQIFVQMLFTAAGES